MTTREDLVDPWGTGRLYPVRSTVRRYPGMRYYNYVVEVAPGVSRPAHGWHDQRPTAVQLGALVARAVMAYERRFLDDPPAEIALDELPTAIAAASAEIARLGAHRTALETIARMAGES